MALGAGHKGLRLVHECWLGPLEEQGGRHGRVPEANGSQATCGWTWSMGRQAGQTLGQLLQPACLPLPLRFPCLSPVRVPGDVAASGRSPVPLLDGCCAISHGVLDLVLRGKRALSPAPVLVKARRRG